MKSMIWSLSANLLLSILIAGCVGAPTTPDASKDEPELPSNYESRDSRLHPPHNDRVDEPAIDLLGLQNSLGLSGEKSDVGYKERGFNTCEVGYGYSSTHECRSQTFVSIRFQLECRESEGTISNADYATTPITSSQIKWNLGRAKGLTSTDGSGYGEVLYIADGSQAKQKLRLTLNGKYLALEADEVRRVVTPGDWCPR